MSEYTPDRWVIVEIETGTEKLKKALSGWYGGYLNGESWHLSSVITEMTKTDTGYTLTTESGSHYTLHNDAYGLSGYTAAILSSLLEQANGTQTSIRVWMRMTQSNVGS